MSLEEALQANTAALTALTAQLKAGGGTSSSAGSTSSSGGDYKPQHTHEEMKSLIKEIRDKKSPEAGVKVFKDITGKDKTADITDPKDIDKVYDAAKKFLKEMADDV